MRALISVYDKTGIVPLAKELLEQGYELLSTGGSLKVLQEAGCAVTPVEEVTGFPELLGGRVKTLHPAIHAGLLARKSDPEHLRQIQEQGIEPIDLVVCNLYPFEEGLKKDLPLDEMIELIDIGGPTMIRSAAKNYLSVFVLCSSDQYEEFVTRLKEDRADAEYRKSLAAAAFSHCAGYDARIATYLNPDLFPEHLHMSFKRTEMLRYGENPHQSAAFYTDSLSPGLLSNAKLLGGKPLSYNNLRDADAAIGLAYSFDEGVCIAVKHCTPCGAGRAATALEAYELAYSCDPVSIFGGIVALNMEVDAPTAQKMSEIFLEVVAAPGFTDEALEILTRKKNLRVLEVHGRPSEKPMITSVDGGILLQSPDMELVEKLEVVSERQPSEEELEGLLFAFQVVKFAKSNAIVVSDGKKTAGIGAGNVNRIDATRIALERGQGGTLLASDAFFPFDDVVEEAARMGIRAIIQPGGSIQDQASIDACNRHGIALVFTGMRHFRH
ncbi:MAG TPA: bifunctional phosphoribosylaminoimidazolecarboxamide formyltransferase/IMP cyclohydrolase [Tissierellia bacterium]|nr:bifunctional phosphoribosylaminoimidazolecarboxamide formyltransferase/IMP cyclohydrolase [Tissierellia bacterium]